MSKRYFICLFLLFNTTHIQSMLLSESLGQELQGYDDQSPESLLSIGVFTQYYPTITNNILRMQYLSTLIQHDYEAQRKKQDVFTSSQRTMLYKLFEYIIKKILTFPFYEKFLEKQKNHMLTGVLNMHQEKDLDKKYAVVMRCKEIILSERCSSECKVCGNPSPETLFPCNCHKNLFCSELCMQFDECHRGTCFEKHFRACTKIKNRLIKLDMILELIEKEYTLAKTMYGGLGKVYFLDQGRSIALFSTVAREVLNIDFYKDILVNEKEKIEVDIGIMCRERDINKQVEIASKIKNRIFAVRSHSECVYCGDPAPKTLFPCDCHKVMYCSQVCFDLDKRHERACEESPIVKAAGELQGPWNASGAGSVDT